MSSTDESTNLDRKAEERDLKTRLKEAKDTIHALKAAAREHQCTMPKGSTVLRSEVLWQVLSRRVATLGAPYRRPEDEAYAEDFRIRSKSYRTVCERGDRRLDGVEHERVQIAGLSWCVPKERDGIQSSFRDRIVRRRWLPLADILATRDLAVGHTMLDIGANIGTTSIPRVVLGDFRRIYAAEPEPTNYACLVENVVASRLDGSVLPDQVAIGASDRDATFVMAEGMATHYLRGRIADADERSVATVPCRTLDTWVSDMGIDLDAVTFIKIDTQGAEGDILRGAPRVLARKHIAWQIEFWPYGLHRMGFDVRELFDLVRRNFTHVIDLGARHQQAEPRGTGQLAEMLSHLDEASPHFTDLLLYNASDSWSMPLAPKDQR